MAMDPILRFIPRPIPMGSIIPRFMPMGSIIPRSMVIMDPIPGPIAMGSVIPGPMDMGPILAEALKGKKRNYLGNYPRQLIAIVPPGACSSHPLPESPVQPQELQGALPALPQEEAEEQGGDAGHRRHQVVLVDVAVVHEARRRGRKHGPVPVLLSIFPVHRVVVVPAPMMTWHLVLAHHAHVHVHVHAARVGHGHPHHAGMVGFDVCSSAKKCQKEKVKESPGRKSLLSLFFCVWLNKKSCHLVIS